jgi:peptidoglycan/xylan/chitin deacetylase (PgdA/CDA1 family)
MRAIPVLMYHHVNAVGRRISVTPEYFENHMRYLKNHGYRGLSSEEFLAVIKGDQPADAVVDGKRFKPVVITFDDGWLDNWVYAFPILKRYGMKAVIFVMTKHLAEGGVRRRADEGGGATTASSSGDVAPLDAGVAPLDAGVALLPEHEGCIEALETGRSRDVMLSWDELRLMEDSGLIDVQSHTHSHTRWDLQNMSSEDKERLLADLRISKELIEKRLGKACRTLCWPYGIYDQKLNDAAVTAGYEVLLTTERGTNEPGCDPLRIKRLPIGNAGALKFAKRMLIYSDTRIFGMYQRIFGG